VSADRESLNEAQQRLSEITQELDRISSETQSGCDDLISGVQGILNRALANRQMRAQIEDLKAEALYLRLLYGLPVEESETPDGGLAACEAVWKEVRAALQPVLPNPKWLERIREVETSRNQAPALSAEERAELERRLKDNVCPICVSFALDGTCTLESFETCPIDLYLNRLVAMIEELGHRPWMEDYFEQMYRDICPGCKGRVDKDYCPPRDEGDCALYSYLPTVIRTIEGFMKERNESGKH